jgi:hypothetical protein
MCRDSLNDEWIYVVKQGVCRVLKSIKLNPDSKNNNKVFVEISKLLSKDVFVIKLNIFSNKTIKIFVGF